MTSDLAVARNHYLAQRLREVLLDGRWIANTNFRDQIEGLDWQVAIETIGPHNSIAALTFHINYYLAGLLSAFSTGRLDIRDTYSFDLPPITTEADWITVVTTFIDNAQRFADAVEKMPDTLFDQPFVDPRYGTYLRNIEGVIEHSYYHLGQVALIRKLISARTV
ncbi:MULTISPECIES: DinB family protein [unclassified Flavobacterium]|uniref:DinB family protein n=1 Tax=unclassified Flavobacterium TaxID=196869 RepID=UPI001F142E44|nr:MULTISPECIES: DinB family protein [unclassified Flavobacterium]UMY67115.1 DinB family protein [Flavobacterium sp. HJ-32-4]